MDLHEVGVTHQNPLLSNLMPEWIVPSYDHYQVLATTYKNHVKSFTRIADYTFAFLKTQLFSFMSTEYIKANTVKVGAKTQPELISLS